MTHERTIQTMGIAARIICVIVLIMGIMALYCCTNPTGSSSVPTHPNEILIASFTQCFAKFNGLPEINVYFKDYLDLTQCDPSRDNWGPKDGKCPAAGRASYGYYSVSYWGPWVRGEIAEYPIEVPWMLREVAAHEVGHVKCGNEEWQANMCMFVALESGECE